MTYRESLSYLDSLINYEKKSDFDYVKSMKLERMRSFARRMGDPQKDITAIHVGGTKGKGSASSMINSILMEAGYEVGLYTSPHLFSFRERMRVNGGPIGEEEVVKLVDEMRPYIEQMAKEGNKPTYFEVCTMMAFLYFRSRDVRLIVLEVGMGGRLDSTNIVNAMVSVITPISFDHTQFLGNTLKAIAYEKCGIIKNNAVTISSCQKKEAMDVIGRISVEKKARLRVVGKDIIFEIINSDIDGQSFRLFTGYREYARLAVKLLGGFQIENAAAAVAAVEELSVYNIFIPEDVIRDGLDKARWPGRLELVHKKPYVVVDGAQDVNSISRLKEAVKDIFEYKKLFLIFGAMQDKDIDGICRQLRGISYHIVTTKAKSGRACPPETIKEKMLKCDSKQDVVTADTVSEAVKECIGSAEPDDLILVTGSLYVVAEAMQVFAEVDFSASTIKQC